MSLFLLACGSVAALLFVWFVQLERQGRAVTIVLLVLWLLVIESALYASMNQIPQGLFHPGIGADPDPNDDLIESAISFRVPDFIILVAIGAHLYARGLPERVRVSSVWFFAFFTWLVGAALIGLNNGNSPDLIAFELKAILYLGVFALAAAVPFRAYTEGNGLYRLLYGSAAIAAVLIVTDGLSVASSFDIPLIPLHGVGALGADAAGIFVSLGMIAVALAFFQEQRRFRLLGAAGPLLLTPAVADQRAAIITLGVAIVVFGLGVTFTRRSLKVTPTEIGLVGLLVVFLAMLPPILDLARGAPNAKLPFAASVEETFQGTAKRQSAQSRVNQWRKAAELIEERPVSGWGLGKTYVHYDPGHREFFESNYTHNIGGDLLVRAGAIGLALFLLAMLLVCVEGLGAWRRHTDDVAAVLGLASVAIISGLLARGMVESLFEKYRLATMLGIVMGMVGSVAVQPVRARLERADESWRSGTSFAR